MRRVLYIAVLALAIAPGCHINAPSEQEHDTDTGSDTGSDTDTDVDTDSDVDTDTDTDVDTDTDTDVDTDTDSDTDSDTGNDSGTGTDSCVDTWTDTNECPWECMTEVLCNLVCGVIHWEIPVECGVCCESSPCDTSTCIDTGTGEDTDTGEDTGPPDCSEVPDVCEAADGGVIDGCGAHCAGMFWPDDCSEYTAHVCHGFPSLLCADYSTSTTEGPWGVCLPESTDLSCDDDSDCVCLPSEGVACEADGYPTWHCVGDTCEPTCACP